MAEILSQINNICRKGCKFKNARAFMKDYDMHDCEKCNSSDICAHTCAYYIYYDKNTCKYAKDGSCKCDIYEFVLNNKDKFNM